MIQHDPHPHAPNTGNRISETEHDFYDLHEPRSEQRGHHEDDEELQNSCPTLNPMTWYRRRAQTAV
jgi:hypothetical protein